MKHFEEIEFSVSLTTRPRRDYEVEGKHYFFVDKAEFERRIAAGDLIEWEQVFSGNGHYYGTLRSYIDDAMAAGKVLLLDVDIKGGLNVQRAYPEESVSLFVQPPSVDELKRRLIARGTDSAEQIAIRMARIPEEMALGKQFDHQIINDDLETAVHQVVDIVEQELYVSKGEHTWD